MKNDTIFPTIRAKHSSMETTDLSDRLSILVHVSGSPMEFVNVQERLTEFVVLYKRNIAPNYMLLTNNRS